MNFAHALKDHTSLGVNTARSSPVYSAVIVAAILISYGSYLILDPDTLMGLSSEDGIFENVTAVCFIAASLYFVAAFFESRNRCFLLLALVFFVGCGEEISWGQRIVGFKTPESLAAINVQGEFNVHNIEILNAKDFSGTGKSGVAKVWTVTFLYRLFWLSYGILLPAAALFQPARSFLRKFSIPVPPLAIGTLFMLNWLTYRLCLYFIPEDQSVLYDRTGEVMECISSLIFLVISIWFYRRRTSYKT